MHKVKSLQCDWLEAQQRDWLNSMYDTNNTNNTANSAVRIYRRNFLGIHGSALAQTYPRTLALIGAEKFRYFSQMLLRHHPIQSGDLNQYGKELPELLATFTQEKLPSSAADVARFEWAQLACLHEHGNE